MSEQDPQLRWEALVEDEAAGEALSAEDRAFVADYEQAHPECLAERELWERSLALLGAAPAEATLDAGAQADWTARVLGALEAETPSARPQARPQAHPAEGVAAEAARRPWAWLGAAAAAAALIYVASQGLGPAGEEVADGSRTAGGADGSDRADGPEPRRDPHADPHTDSGAEGVPVRAVDTQATASLLAGTDSQPDALAVGEAFGPGDTLAVPTGRGCLVWTEPTAVVCVEGGTLRVARDAAPGERRVELESGLVLAALDPLGPGQRFVVDTVVGSVSAVGTVFSVELREGRGRAEVFEGVVEVRDPEVQRLRAGEGPLPLRGEVTTELGGGAWTSAELSAELAALAELWRVADGPGQGRLDVRTGGALHLDAVALGIAPLTMSAPVGRHALTRELTRDGEPESIELEAGQPLARGSEASSDTSPAPPKKPPSAAKLAAAAQRSRMARDYGETARLYRALLEHHGDSTEAANVPVRLGDVLMTLGDHAGALAAYERYRKGVLLPEARLGQIKALRALDRDAAADAGIVRFRADYPEDYRADSL